MTNNHNFKIINDTCEEGVNGRERGGRGLWSEILIALAHLPKEVLDQGRRERVEKNGINQGHKSFKIP